MSQEIITRIPAAPEHIHVLRAVVSGVASRAGRSVDDLADLRLLVDEAASLLLRAAPAAALEMSILPSGSGITIALTALAPGVAAPSADGLAWRILTGLADHVEAIETRGGPSIRILMERPPA